jgi:hypothetical protein
VPTSSRQSEPLTAQQDREKRRRAAAAAAAEELTQARGIYLILDAVTDARALGWPIALAQGSEYESTALRAITRITRSHAFNDSFDEKDRRLPAEAYRALSLHIANVRALLVPWLLYANRTGNIFVRRVSELHKIDHEFVDLMHELAGMAAEVELTSNCDPSFETSQTQLALVANNRAADRYQAARATAAAARSNNNNSNYSNVGPPPAPSPPRSTRAPLATPAPRLSDEDRANYNSGYRAARGGAAPTTPVTTVLDIIAAKRASGWNPTELAQRLALDQLRILICAGAFNCSPKTALRNIELRLDGNGREGDGRAAVFTAAIDRTLFAPLLLIFKDRPDLPHTKRADQLSEDARQLLRWFAAQLSVTAVLGTCRGEVAVNLEAQRLNLIFGMMPVEVGAGRRGGE